MSENLALCCSVIFEGTTRKREYANGQYISLIFRVGRLKDLDLSIFDITISRFPLVPTISFNQFVFDKRVSVYFGTNFEQKDAIGVTGVESVC